MKAKVPDWLRIDPSELVLEIISIVIAILLALALNNWQEQRRHADAAHDALVNIRREISANAGTLAIVRPLHLRIERDFSRLIDAHTASERLKLRDLSTIWNRDAHDGFRPLLGDSFAWTLAQNTDAISYVPYEDRLLLTRLYTEQAFTKTVSLRFIDQVFAPSNTVNGDFYLGAVSDSLILGDVVASESRLSALYAEALKRLPT